MAKEILLGSEARIRIKKGIDKAAEAVKPTLGVIGKHAIIEYPGLDPIEADDGVTILKNLEFKDPYENLGLHKLRKAALRTSSEGGDGTATTTVLTEALVKSAFKEIGEDSSRIREVRERLQTGLKEVLEKLSETKKEVGKEDIVKIATISSLDEEVAVHIADMINEVGINGVITVEKGSQLGYTKELVKGARFNSGLISPYFINDNASQSAILEDAYIVIVDRKISTNEQIISLLQSIGTGKDILFIADAIDSVALATLAANAQQKIANIACVVNPYSASRARDFLFDIAALTGGTVISEETGMRLDKAEAGLCGRADKIIVTRDTTTIVGGRSDNTLQTRALGIENEIQESTSEFNTKILQERLAQLTAGIGVIRVGAYTDTEYNAKKYKFENAINATQAALQEGVVIGGGAALAKLEVTEPLFHEALLAPIKQMAINAGMDPFSIAHEIKHDFPVNGYDFKNKKSVDMHEAGIIDPYKVVRLALESATAITSALVNIEVAITKEEEKELG